MSVSQNFPEVRPTLNLNFARSKTLDPRITFTRASTGTYVGSDGLIKTAAADEARFDHDPTTGESLGLLIEEQRTKIRDAVGYPLGSLSATSSTDILAPDGTTSGIIKITSPSFTNTSGLQQRSVDTSYFAHSVTQNVYYTSSVYVYATGNTDSSRKVQLGSVGGGCLDSAGGPQLTSCGYIDGKDTIQSSTSFTVTLPKNRWVRVFLNWRSTCSSSTGRSAAQVRPLYWITNNQQNTNFINSDGNPVMYLWGSTVETNYSTSSASFPTSYIYGNNVTRQPDTSNITGTNFSSWYNPTEGSFYVKEDSSNNALDKYYIFVSDGANNDRLWILKDSINRHVFRVYDSANTLQVVSTSPTLPTSFEQVSSQFVGAYFSGNSNSALNGSIVGAATNNTFVRSGSNSAYLGSSPSGNFLNGHLSRLTYWSERLTDTQLQNLTK